MLFVSVFEAAYQLRSGQMAADQIQNEIVANPKLFEFNSIEFFPELKIGMACGCSYYVYAPKHVLQTQPFGVLQNI